MCQFRGGIICKSFKNHLIGSLNNIKEAGLYKSERVIDSPQDALVVLEFDYGNGEYPRTKVGTDTVVIGD